MKEKVPDENQKEMYEREKGVLERAEWKENAQDAEFVSHVRETIQSIDSTIAEARAMLQKIQEELDLLVRTSEKSEKNENAGPTEESIALLKKHSATLEDAIASQTRAKQDLEDEILKFREINMKLYKSLRPDERLQ